MVSADRVKAAIEANIPEAQADIQDLTGGGDHYQAIVISPAFVGKTLVQQHQWVYQSLKQELSTEAIHALALKTYTPETWAAAAAQ